MGKTQSMIIKLVLKITADANFFCFVINVRLLRIRQLLEKLKSENIHQQ